MARRWSERRERRQHAWQDHVFDGASRPLQFRDPNSAVTGLSCEGSRQLATRVEAGVQTTYQYDAVEVPSKVTFPQAPV